MTAVTFGVAVPSIPPRAPVLASRALPSVAAQTVPVSQISVWVDHAKEGAGPARNYAKNALRTDWTLFLDDDDELLPHHVDACWRHAIETGADVVYPWFSVVGGSDPFAAHDWEHEPWDPGAPHIFPITVLMRTELAQSLDFATPLPDSAQAGEDWPYWVHMNQVAKISHLPERTWRWHWDPAFPNTSGMPSRWR